MSFGKGTTRVKNPIAKAMPKSKNATKIRSVCPDESPELEFERQSKRGDIERPDGVEQTLIDTENQRHGAAAHARDDVGRTDTKPFEEMSPYAQAKTCFSPYGPCCSYLVAHAWCLMTDGTEDSVR